MKVNEPHGPTQPDKAGSGKSFAELLKSRPAVTPKAAPAKATPTRPASTIAPSAARPAVLPRTRDLRAGALPQKSHAATVQAGRQLEASRRTDKALSHAHTRSARTSRDDHDERSEARLRTALQKEIERDPTASIPSPSPAAPADPSSRSEPAQQAGGTERAEAIASLVERMEVALKGGQPTMSLGLVDRSGAASIEIARTGKGEVAVRITARAGGREALAATGDRIREALAARGLAVKSLTIA